MNIYVQRLRALQQACAEARTFDMHTYLVDDYCGTPGCALGNYAARTDLQGEFAIRRRYPHGSGASRVMDVVSLQHATGVDFDDPVVRTHFGLSEDEAVELFSPGGCGFAGIRPHAAAAYIERFIARKYPVELLMERLAEVGHHEVA